LKMNLHEVSIPIITETYVHEITTEKFEYAKVTLLY